MGRVGSTSPFRNAAARIVTRAWREHPRSREIIVATEAVYSFPCANSEGHRATGTRPGGQMRLKMLPYDVAALGQVWGSVFDVVTTVVQMKPRSISWEVDTSGLNADDEWLEGAVAAVVHTVAHELDLSVTEKG
jgi:hypothetical protein